MKAAMDLTGQTLGQYRIMEKIGRGGMAEVYKAFQPRLERHVAIKVLPPYFAHDETFLERFEREARAIARLNHPNILPVYDSGQEGELSYIVMRYVEEGTLQEMLGKPWPLDRVVEIITQVGGALDYAHQGGIIHRDVKPSNVLMDKGEWALLSDFGLAKMVESSVQLTKSGAGIGTPAYMSPELGKGEPADERSDIYSLGIVLYEMLTGRVPFEADTPMAVVIEHITTPLPVPRSINPDIPEPVEQVLLKALAKDPAERFQRMGEMVRALQKAVAGEPVVTTVIPLAAEERPSEAGAIAEEVERIAVPPVEKEEAPKVAELSLKALLLRGALIAVPILILAAIGWVAVNRFARPRPQPLAVHLTPVPTAPGTLDVVLGFGNIWHGRSDVQNHLGQPVTSQQSIPYAHQFFATGGYLFERLDIHQIYVLYPTNEWEVYEDEWQEGEDVDDLTPPAEGYAPTQGFGRLWRESPAVRSGLEWGSLPRTTGVDGAVQRFERGLMLFNGLDSKQIYILYITPDNHYRWLMLPDSWKPPPGILFVSDRDGDDEVWVMKSDGSEQIPLTVNTWMDGAPAWSCGGSRIAYTFVAEPGSEEDIMIMKDDTSDKTCLTVNPTARDTLPAWSPDDSRIAFVSYRDGNAEIYVTKIDGSDPINLTNNLTDDWDPTWSPDGSMIAFTSDRDGNPEIYVISSSDGKNLRRLTENETIDEQPAWWQDATSDRIAFVSYRDGNAEIYLMHSDGSHPVNLTNNLAEDKHPTWSPDGSQIAFTSNRDGDREIFVMEADGSNPTNLTDNSVDDWAPHWGR
ncbi:MAG: protein kinase [Anaerolineae bacterium]